MLDETILQTYLDRGEFVYAKNSWLNGKNAERTKRLGITPKKKAYIRRNAPWSKARRYKNAMSNQQILRVANFMRAVADAKTELGVEDPVEAARLAFGEAKPREHKSRAKPVAKLYEEAEKLLARLPEELRKIADQEREAWLARFRKIKAERAAR